MRWRFLLVLGVVGAAVPAAAQAPVETNPCELYRTALCPDLIMAPPDGLFVGRSPRGRLRLYATNHIINVGDGPLEIKGERSGAREMKARQVIHRSGLRPIVTPDAGELYFKFVDSGRGSYWKYSHAARFELWTLDADGARGEMVRTGPKLDYCFRDLDRVRGYARRNRYTTRAARRSGASRATGSASPAAGPTSTRRPIRRTGSTSRG
jgi:hypothetical protein